MTRVCIALAALSLVALFVAYGEGVSVIHGGDAVSHMYWATGAMLAVALANVVAIAHLARAERIISRLRALCERNGIPVED
jgi:hypothetical protein